MKTSSKRGKLCPLKTISIGFYCDLVLLLDYVRMAGIFKFLEQVFKKKRYVLCLLTEKVNKSNFTLTTLFLVWKV